MNLRSIYPIPIVLVLALTAACGPLDRNSGADTTEDLELGEELYSRHCESCHGGETGGEIDDVPPPHNENGHTWHHADCENLRMVMEGNGEMLQQMLLDEGFPEEDVVMPAYEGTLSEDEAMAILNFIKTWWTDEQREQQERRTEDLC